ncbi:hypothetical protein AXYL_03259 [Achromobacter xylosoxidans A8]|uniref:DUF4142 domain-containing protein n=1 Tax=Achromobacter xylosoxidans (strain A8) TaxID=762376 RepID=E3HGS9_ACHXA|nr:DUF4142 domain-containing protein [Achromobacter xylosoxidans]ADP16579.1 hypothetical protein AXYL_03259 [Achromobacter xylosoxidans A8]
MKKTTWLCGIVAICLLIAPGVLGGVRAQELAEPEARFLQAAAGSGMFEAEAAELAKKRAGDGDVKAFAAKMLEQHRAMNAELKTLAASKQVKLPTEPSEPDRGTLEQLSNRTGADFDALYIEKAAMDAHTMANRLFETAARESKDPQVREFAARSLPMLAQHLAMARKLQGTAPADPDKIQPAVKGEAPAVSPASREAPASIAPPK